MKKQIKRTFKCVLTLLISAVMFTGLGIAALAYEGTATDSVNVRDAVTTGNVLGQLTVGQKVEIKGEAGTDATGQVWYEIDYNGRSGYVTGKYIKTDGNQAAGGSEPADPDVTTTPEMNAKVANVDQVNVRAGAGINFPKVTSLTRGTEVKVTGEAMDSEGKKWYRIIYNNSSEGYIRNDFLEVDESSAVTPPEEDPAASESASTTEAPVTEDPGAGTQPGGLMGQQYTVAYKPDATGESLPYLIDNNSSSQWEVSKLIDSYEQAVKLQDQAGQNSLLKIVCIVLAVVAVAAIVLLLLAGMRFRKYMEGGDPSYDDDHYDDDDDYGDDEDDYDDEEEDDDYDDAPPKKKGGFLSKFKRDKRRDYDDEDEDDEAYDDYDDEEDDEPVNPIRRVYSPERSEKTYDDSYGRDRGRDRESTSSRAGRRPRNFMEDEDDDFEYGFLGDDDDR